MVLGDCVRAHPLLIPEKQARTPPSTVRGRERATTALFACRPKWLLETSTARATPVGNFHTLQGNSPDRVDGTAATSGTASRKLARWPTIPACPAPETPSRAVPPAVVSSKRAAHQSQPRARRYKSRRSARALSCSFIYGGERESRPEKLMSAPGWIGAEGLLQYEVILSVPVGLTRGEVRRGLGAPPRVLVRRSRMFV